MEGDVIKQSLRGVSYLALVQVTSRLLTFLLNVLLTRYMENPQALGVASVQLYLLYTTGLSLARESVRRVCLRIAPASSTRDEQQMGRGTWTWQVVNLLWWCILFGSAVLTPIVCAVFVMTVDDKSIQGVPRREYERSIAIMALAISIELLCEPMFVISQGQLEYRARSIIEACAVLMKTLATVFAALVLDIDLEAFALGYLSYGITLLLGYALFFRRWKHIPILREGTSNVPPKVWNLRSFQDLAPSHGLKVQDEELLQSVWTFSKQSVLKLLLAEGEKFVMVFLSTTSTEQAIYGLVFNLGSLVARFMFQPIEEVAYSLFGKLNDMGRKHAGQEDRLWSLLETLCQLMIIFGLAFVSFGPSYAHLLIHLLYGETWSRTGASRALGYYCFYVLVIAVNGITEAFVHAVADADELDRFNRALVVCSVVYLSCAALCLQFGAIGLILANCVNMVMRIAFSTHYISKWLIRDAHAKRQPSSKSLWDLVPGSFVWLSFGLSYIVASASERYVYKKLQSWKAAAIHVGVGAICFVACSLTIYATQRDLIRSFINLIRTGEQEKKSK